MPPGDRSVKHRLQLIDFKLQEQRGKTAGQTQFKAAVSLKKKKERKKAASSVFDV